MNRNCKAVIGGLLVFFIFLSGLAPVGIKKVNAEANIIKTSELYDQGYETKDFELTKDTIIEIDKNLNMDKGWSYIRCNGYNLTIKNSNYNYKEKYNPELKCHGILDAKNIYLQDAKVTLSIIQFNKMEGNIYINEKSIFTVNSYATLQTYNIAGKKVHAIIADCGTFECKGICNIDHNYGTNMGSKNPEYGLIAKNVYISSSRASKIGHYRVCGIYATEKLTIEVLEGANDSGLEISCDDRTNGSKYPFISPNLTIGKSTEISDADIDIADYDFDGKTQKTVLQKNGKPPYKVSFVYGTSKKYSNEWIDGKWYDENGNQTYNGTLSWKSNSTGWWVEDSAGWYPQSQWQKIDGVWYYFKSDGYMASAEYYKGYWFNADGSWDDQYKLSWKSNFTGWWVEDKSGWWPSSKWLKIDGSWYYFDGSGYMVTNQYVDGYWIGSDGVCS